MGPACPPRRPRPRGPCGLTKQTRDVVTGAPHTVQRTHRAHSAACTQRNTHSAHRAHAPTADACSCTRRTNPCGSNPAQARMSARDRPRVRRATRDTGGEPSGRSASRAAHCRVDLAPPAGPGTQREQAGRGATWARREQKQGAGTHTSAHARALTRTHAQPNTHTHTDTQTHRHTHRHTDTQTHRHTHRHRHTQTHTDTHTHRQTHTQSRANLDALLSCEGRIWRATSIKER